MEPTLLRALSTIASSYFINLAVIPPNPPAPPDEQKGYERGRGKSRDPLPNVISVSSLTTFYLVNLSRSQ